MQNDNQKQSVDMLLLIKMYSGPVDVPAPHPY